MPSHQLRVIVIAGLAAIALIGVIILVAMGVTEGTGFGVVAGVLATAVPALFDSLAVEARRRNPEVPAISDDIKSSGEGNNAGA